MASITLAGTLLDPNSDLSVGDELRFTHDSTTGQTLKGAVSKLIIGQDGAYSLPLQYGLVLVEYKDSRSTQFKNLGVATVNGDNPATTIPELLNALVPVSSAELIEFQAILADAVTAKNAAVVAETGAVTARDVAVAASIIQYQTFAGLLAISETVDYKQFTVAERANAAYTLQPAGYVALAGDATLANGRVAELQIDGEANVLKFGAKGNGSFNDSSAIRDAFARFSKNVVFDGNTPSNYNYGDATGVSVFSDAANIKITNKSRKVIAINNACYLINLSAPINTFTAKSVNTLNGLGFYRNTWAEANVKDQFIIKDCVFMDYKRCAISEESTDHPYVLIRNNVFRGDFSSQTIGVSLSGLQDTNIVEMNKFQANYIHLRVPALSGSLTIRNNGFINLNAGSTKFADIWVVPQSQSVTINGAGVGTLCHANRHGIEHQSAPDSKIIIANSLAGGTDVALPDLVTRTGYVTGFVFDSNRVAGGTIWSGAFIKSYIKQFRNNILDNTIVQSYGAMSYLIDFAETPTESFKSFNVIKDTVYPAFNPEVDNMPLTNGFSDVDDSFYQSVGRNFNNSSSAKVDTKVIYKNHDTANSGYLNNVTRTAIANPQYPAISTAAELTMGSSGAYFAAFNGTLPVSQITEGRFINIELDTAKGATNSAESCFILLNDIGNGKELAKFNIKLSNDFQRHSFKIKIANTTYSDLRFQVFVSGYTATTNKIKLANIDINMSYANSTTTHLATTGDGGFDNPHVKLGDYNLWVDSTGRLRIKSTEPTSDTDGIVVGSQT